MTKSLSKPTVVLRKKIKEKKQVHKCNLCGRAISFGHQNTLYCEKCRREDEILRFFDQQTNLYVI